MMKYLLHSIRILYKSAAQYRASFLMQIVSQTVMVAGDLLAVLVLLDRFTRLGQWQPGEILFFFGVMQVAFALTECFGRGISNFASYVGSGEFDTLLIRPRSLLLQVICHRLDPRRIGGFMVGLTALMLASLHLHLQWTWGMVCALVLCIIGSVLLLNGLFLIEATVSFFSVRSIEMVNVLTYGGRTACQYPIDIYPGPIRLLFTWVAPFALCMHLPVSWVLGRPLYAVPDWCVFLAPAAGAVFFAAMVRVWYVGVKHYRSTGT